MRRLIAFPAPTPTLTAWFTTSCIGGHGAQPVDCLCRIVRDFRGRDYFSPAPARSQSCDLGSIVNDFANVGDALTGPACDQAYADSAALTVAASVLGGLLAADPSAGKSLCGDVQNLFSNGQSAANVNELVNNYFGSGFGPGSELIGVLSQVAGPLATLSCACSIIRASAKSPPISDRVLKRHLAPAFNLSADIQEGRATARTRFRSPATIARRR